MDVKDIDNECKNLSNRKIHIKEFKAVILIKIHMIVQSYK